MKKLPKQLFHLLRLHSPSGKEWGVVKYLLPVLRDITDHVELDNYGNLLAQKKYGDSGYTVLLSAHMDTVAREQPVPRWRNGKTEIYNSAGNSALGGDDKCGIAAILAIIRQLNRGTQFTGTIKVCFSREEEIGCIGATRAIELNPSWFDDIHAAIVLDRRGGNDIITGMSWANFCSPEYGRFWEEMARKTGFKARVTEGTISDTMEFSQLGINGVNLSVGYYHAHTKDEYIKIHELERTVRWVLTALDHIETYSFPSFTYDVPFQKYLGKDWWKSYYSYTDKRTVAYCDFCGHQDYADNMFCDDDFYLCEECIDSMVISTCDNCLADAPSSQIIEYKGSEICLKCLSELEDDYEKVATE